MERLLKACCRKQVAVCNHSGQILNMLHEKLGNQPTGLTELREPTRGMETPTFTGFSPTVIN